MRKAGTTQAELARMLGLSRSTVAAVLNPHSTVRLSEATRRRVLQAVERKGYRPHRYAQIMRVGKSGVVGLFHFGGLSQVAAERVWHASNAIQAAGYQVLTNDASWASGGVAAGCEAMADARVEGVLVAGWNEAMNGRAFKILQKAKIPVVALSGSEVPWAPQVRADTRSAFHGLTTHVLGQGRRRLMLLLALGREARLADEEDLDGVDLSGAERVEGFCSALREGGGRLVARFEASRRGRQGCLVSGNLERDRFNPFRDASQVLRRELAENALPDAIVCGNDDWAIGAMAVLREVGLRVPEDVAVTGFDNTSVGAYLAVPLTTVAQPGRTMAEHAVSLLFKKIQGGRVSLEPVRFPCELVVRASCGAKHILASS